MVILLFFLSLTTGLDAAAISPDLTVLACRKNPSLSFCGRLSGGAASAGTADDTDGTGLCDAQQEKFVADCLNAECPRTNQGFCENFARKCSIPLTELACDDGEKRCAAYRTSYGRYCNQTKVVPAVIDFCKEYCQDCGKGNTCAFEAETLPFCENYKDDSQSICRQNTVGVEYLRFCHDYSVACRSPIGPTGVQEVPSGQTSCAQEQSKFIARCQKLAINAQHTDYCITASDGCGWSLGPPVPDANADENLDGVPPSLPGEQATQNPEAQLRQICKQNEARARLNCFQAIHVAPQHIEPCARYVRDCKQYYEDDEPLRRAASLFNSKVGIGNQFGITGIPYYPFNREGALGIGNDTEIGFGTWGGGVAKSTGVGDFWRRDREVGANWYEGRYGATNQWAVPLLPFISGSNGTEVNVPINERTLGQPITVNKGVGVGNFYSQNKGPSVDWLNGNIGISNPSWAVPIVGISGGRTQQIGFPSVANFAALKYGTNLAPYQMGGIGTTAGKRRRRRSMIK